MVFARRHKWRMANDETIKVQLQREVTSRGANAVAKDLGVPRGTLISFLCGRAHVGSALLIVTRARANFDVVPDSTRAA